MSWQWDPTLYAGAASYYARGRVAYPPALADLLAAQLLDTSGPLPHPEPPRAAIADLVRRYLGPERRAGQGVLPAGTPGGEDGIYRTAGFTGPRRLELPGYLVERTADQVVAAVLSLSGSAPHLFGSGLAAFEADLRALLHDTSPTGVFSQRMREIALDLWTP